MKIVEIVCPTCKKLLAKASEDSKMTLICWCRRCKSEKVIKYDGAKEPKRKV